METKVPSILTVTGPDTVSAWSGRFHASFASDAWLVTDSETGAMYLVDSITEVAHEVAITLNREEMTRTWHHQIVNWSAPSREYEDAEYPVTVHDDEGNRFTLAIIRASEPEEFFVKLHACLLRCDLDPGLPELRHG